ncbi:hypothetical protein OU787_12100 [Kitasatospora sp. YST-16]|uniref:hypothetical protein n=1 Tax=Kitasatospora sp. YST-16 TaxID=2998080 RepID=UPI00228522BD|nr:hypothetical protein [Kitasatospora sp. YST-16]WAL72177.1 hypothetical protein OU787_12100 [Kitasatospora sp. YST-16]WNW38219.1 hypothetical protein RKE32_12055 [Streptomyces sp. Li-HN-5-13]
MSEIRHNYGETDRMARRLMQHAERLHGAAGPHSGNAHKRLLKHHGQDPLASAVANGSTKILDVIRKAESQLQEHLQNMAKGLQQTSKNHEQNDKNLEDALKKILRLDSKADGVRKAQGPEHHGPKPGLEPHTITLEWKHGMPRLEFMQKAMALQRLGKQGKLFNAPKVAREKELTTEYKNALIQILHNEHKGSPNYDKIMERVHAMEADHINELQLGGQDSWKNLRMLHKWTNWDIGSQQINRSLEDHKVPVGTPIKIKVKWKWW